MSDVPATFVAHIGRDAAARCAPRTVFTGGSFAARAGITRQPIGSIGRAASGFGRVLGLSQVQRWTMQDHAAEPLGGRSVRPPIDYWPFADDEEAVGTASRREVAPVVAAPRSPASKRGRVDRVEALRRMLEGGAQASAPATGQAGASPRQAPERAERRSPGTRAPAHRGLPITMRRQGRTWAGPGTSPGRTSATSAPQNTGSVPAARVEPTRAERGERSAGTDGAQEDRRPAQGRARAARSPGRQRPSTRHQAVASLLPTDDGLVAPVVDPTISRPASALGRAIEPAPLLQPSAVLSTAMSTHQPAAAELEPTQRATSSDHPVLAAPEPPAKAGRRRKKAAPVDADTSPSPSQADLQVVTPESRADDGGLTRLTSLPSSLTEPLTRAEPAMTRQAEPLVDASIDSAVPRVTASELPVAPSVAAATEAALESALARRVPDAAQRSTTPAGRPNADRPVTDRTSDDRAKDDRASAEVLRPIPLASVARRSAVEPARSLAPLRIGDARRVRVQRTPDGRAVVWNDQAMGAVAHSAVVDDRVIALTTISDAVPTVARPLDRALQDELPFVPDLPAQEYDSIVETPLRARPPLPVAVISQATDGVAPPPEVQLLSARSEGDRPATHRPDAAQPVQPVQPVPAVRQPQVAARHAVATTPAARGREWVPATPGSLLGVNLLRRRPMHVDRAVGPLPSLDRSPLDQSPSPIPSDAPISTIAPPAGFARTVESAGTDVGAPVRRTVDRSNEARPIDLVSDAAVAPRPITVVRSDLGGHAVTTPSPVVAGRDHDERLQRSAAIGRADRAVAGSPRAQATDLAERFLAELVRHRDERPTELPTVFRSIADVIVGDRRPLVSTSTASRRALAAVGKSAVTTGDVIHLADPISAGTPSGRLTELVAHELTHVAHASPEPRFFDDDRDSAEERRAHQVGELMRTAPLAPRVIGASMAVQRTLDPGVSSPSTQRGGGSGGDDTVSAAGLAARLTGGASPNTIRRSPASTSSGSVIRREVTVGSEQTMSQSEEQAENISPAPDFASQLRDHFDLIVDLLEERIIVDLERRGGRFRGDF